MNLNLRKPCANCPFLKEGAIELAPGRIEDIIDDLTKHDGSNFLCHKTVHSQNGGTWTEDEGEEGQHYAQSGKESMCIGSAVYMLKLGRPSVSLRFALIANLITVADLTEQNDKIIEPLE